MTLDVGIMNIKLSKRSQTQKNANCTILFTEFKTGKTKLWCLKSAGWLSLSREGMVMKDNEEDFWETENVLLIGQVMVTQVCLLCDSCNEHSGGVYFSLTLLYFDYLFIHFDYLFI